jgi:hypothetical protein
MTDIFTFWSRIERGAHVHPADVKTFERMDAERHGFHLECLPGCSAGDLVQRKFTDNLALVRLAQS